MQELDRITTAIAKNGSRLGQVLSKAVAGGEIRISDFEIALEWFITWRIKLVTPSNPFWCDGVTDLNVTVDNDEIISVTASIRIGPESDVMNIYKGELQGTFHVKENNSELVAYDILVSENGRTYEMRS
ncbi:MAG: hypothetical protein ABW124_22275 [Candidatus Thiodiazotropha sp. 6PLUC9]